MKAQYEPRQLSQKLGYLVEECGEVLAAVGKTIRWGLESTDPTSRADAPETNREWILRELQDLKGAIARAEQALERGDAIDEVSDGATQTGRRRP